MSGLGEQIAVLDGLGALDPSDGRIGQTRARVDQYARLVRRNVLAKRNMIQASGGANYAGGSTYFPGSPLLPSSAGLAGMFGDIPSVLPHRYNVISPSGGVNYGGGSSYAPGLPLLPSNAGLAASLIDGGYGRAGLGAALINGGYGRAGLGGTGTAVDEDLAAAAESIAVARRLDPNDGRIGQFAPQVDEYGNRVMPGVLARSNVIDPSEGANYGGGSSYAPRMPLLPSSAGLAGCGCPAPGLSGFGATRAALLTEYKSTLNRAKKYRAISLNRKFSEGVRGIAEARWKQLLRRACAMRPSLGFKPCGRPRVQTAPNTQQWR
jgi:hypothetical protein